MKAVHIFTITNRHGQKIGTINQQEYRGPLTLCLPSVILLLTNRSRQVVRQRRLTVKLYR